MHKELNKVLSRAKNSPFYKSKNLPKKWNLTIPITTKEDLRKGYPFGFLATRKNKIVTFHESSGSEGKPIASYFSELDWDDIASRFLRNAITLNKNDLFFIKTPYSMVTTAHQAQYAAKLSHTPVVPGDNRSTNMPYSRVVQILNELQVTVSWSLPIEPILWKLAADSNSYSLKQDFSHLRAFWVAGEPLSLGKKKAIKRLWNGKKVFEDYGSTETGSLAGQCSQGQMHLWNDRVYFEVLKANKEITLFGRGRLLVTPLFREAMPLLRYLIEDEIEIKESQCSCGSLFPTIQILGRQSSLVILGNKQLSPLEIEDSVYRLGKEMKLLLSKCLVGFSGLQIEFYGEKVSIKAKKTFNQLLENELGVVIQSISRPLDYFISQSLLKSKLTFSKPRFIFHHSEKKENGIQYP